MSQDLSCLSKEQLLSWVDELVFKASLILKKYGYGEEEARSEVLAIAERNLEAMKEFWRQTVAYKNSVAEEEKREIL